MSLAVLLAMKHATPRWGTARGQGQRHIPVNRQDTPIPRPSSCRKYACPRKVAAPRGKSVPLPAESLRSPIVEGAPRTGVGAPERSAESRQLLAESAGSAASPAGSLQGP